MTQRLRGKVAVIIGGASGIGQSITKLFLQQGAQVIITYEQNNPDHVSFHAELTKAQVTNVTFVGCDDTSDESDVKKAFEIANNKLDIMVINASKPNNPDSKILGTDDAQFARALKVNVHRAFLAAKLATDVMTGAKKGVILFTSGDALLTPEVCPYAYAMLKHALFGLAYNLSAELGKQNIRVSYISPPSKEKKKAAEGATGACGNLKEVVVESEKVAEEALRLSRAVLEDGGPSKRNQSRKKLGDGLGSGNPLKP